MKSGAERRRSRRFAGRLAMRYRLIPFDGSAYHDAVVEDISMEGVRFRCLSGLRKHAGMLVELMFPDDQTVRSFGRAAWVRELPGHAGFEVGGWFEDPGSTARTSLSQHLEHCAAAAVQ